MLKREIEILQMFNGADCYASNRLHEAFKGKHDLSHIADLVERGLLANDGANVRLTQEGYKVIQKEIEQHAIAEEEKKLRKAQKREDSRQNLIHDLIVATFSAAIGAVATLLIQHFQSVIEFINKAAEIISSLFH